MSGWEWLFVAVALATASADEPEQPSGGQVPGGQVPDEQWHTITAGPCPGLMYDDDGTGAR